MPFAEVRGRKIYYEIHGEGDTVVLLHHGFASTRMWTQIYPSLMEAGYRVVIYDRRGYGQSEPGDDFDEFYVRDDFVEDSAKDLAELSKVLDLGAFHIVGQCEGGVVGVDYAGTFPQQVRSLVISSTLAFSTTTIVEFNRLKFPKAFHELDDGIRDKIVLWHGADRAEPFYEMARTRGGAYGTDMFDLQPQLRYVTCPALVVYPDRSALFEVEQGVALYRGLLKGELAVIPRCGHNTYEQHEAYSRHVLNFLNRLTEGANAESADFSMTCIAPAPSGSG